MIIEIEHLREHLEKATDLAEKVHEEFDYECESCPLCGNDGTCWRFEIGYMLSRINAYRLAKELERKTY